MTKLLSLRHVLGTLKKPIRIAGAVAIYIRREHYNSISKTQQFRKVLFKAPDDALGKTLIEKDRLYLSVQSEQEFSLHRVRNSSYEVELVAAFKYDQRRKDFVLAPAATANEVDTVIQIKDPDAQAALK